jgi:hypothetical protein
MDAQQYQARIQADVERANAARLRARADVEGVLHTARLQGRQVLTPAEQRVVESARDRRDREVAALDRHRQELAQIGVIAQEDADWYARTQQIRPVQPARMSAGPYDRAARIGFEERTYRPDHDPDGKQFLADIIANFMYQSPVAVQRLARHAQEERVERPGLAARAAGDANTGSFAGLTVPQYLTEMYAPATAALAPLIANCNTHPLPPQGMAIDISRITTATSAALQANELDAVSSTSIDDTLLTIPVQTIAGQQKVSRQAIERGAGVEDVTMNDLFARVLTTMESTLINQASTGLLATAGTSAVTYTDTSPSAGALWPKLFGAHSLLEQALLARAPVDLVAMHPRRFNWLAGQVGSTWPFMGAQSSSVDPQQGMFAITNEYGPAVRAILSNGDKLCVSANIPTNLGVGTNQDVIIVAASGELHVWREPQTMYIRAEQPAAANLGVLLVAYEYVALGGGQRYSNNPATVGGTGLVAPAGY